MGKSIKFYPINQQAANFTDPPTPASKYNIPKWFKNLPKYQNNESKFFYNGQTNLTVKSCLPVVDGFTSGYTLNLNCDLQVTRENGKAIFRWSFNPGNLPDPVIYRQRKEGACGWDELEGYDDLEFNWFPTWCIKTPKGYSSIFMHPINRIDLPFYTLGGIIDTDKWGDAGNHPFLLKKDWEGIIPKNTPITQFIPFKRESWNSESDPEMTLEYTKQLFRRDSFLKDYYKRFIWNSKDYK